jgi:uncharacterized Zn-binding protein involved in type VI secretion
VTVLPAAARLADPTGHGTPLGSGPGSTDVKIGYMKAWRALPAGVGSGIESATAAVKSLMDSPMLRPPDTVDPLADIMSGLNESAAASAEHGNAAAVGATSTAMTQMTAANATLTTAYTSASSSGPEPAAAEAYAKGLQAAVAAAAGAAISAIASITDTHTCPTPSGPAPHGPGVVTKGSATVFINYLPASRQGDKVFEAAGGPDPISKGCDTVNIGDNGGGAGATLSAAGYRDREIEPNDSVAGNDQAVGAPAGNSAPGGSQAASTVVKEETVDGVTFREFSDGTKETLDASGGRVVSRPGGQVERYDENGQLREVLFADGGHMTRDDDGTVTSVNKDQSKVITSPDGTTSVHNADGSVREVQHPDGSVTRQNDDGTVTTLPASGPHNP